MEISEFLTDWTIIVFQFIKVFIQFLCEKGGIACYYAKAKTNLFKICIQYTLNEFFANSSSKNKAWFYILLKSHSQLRKKLIA